MNSQRIRLVMFHGVKFQEGLRVLKLSYYNFSTIIGNKVFTFGIKLNTMYHATGVIQLVL